MATVSSVTRQLSSLDISTKKGFPSSHVKQSSQPNVAKLLTKFAAPNIPTNIATQPKLKLVSSQSSLRNPIVTTVKNVDLPSPEEDAPKTVDIGTYDGGLEADDQPEIVDDSAKNLALDSSTSTSVYFLNVLVTNIASANIQLANGRSMISTWGDLLVRAGLATYTWSEPKPQITSLL